MVVWLQAEVTLVRDYGVRYGLRQSLWGKGQWRSIRWAANGSVNRRLRRRSTGRGTEVNER
jgi:hypothetical protein